MKLAFFFSIYQDELWAVRLVHQIRKYYGDVQIFAVTDGPSSNEAAKEELLKQRCHLVETEQRLKQLGGGAFTQRWVDAVATYIDTDTDAIIKLDPDSYIWRFFANIPNADVFGDLYWNRVTESNGVKGGCLGLSYGFLLQLAESGLLLSDVLNDVKFTYRRYGTKQRKKIGDQRNGASVASEDSVLSWCYRELGVVPYQWDEVASRQSVDWLDSEGYAVTHPNRCWW